MPEPKEDGEPFTYVEYLREASEIPHIAQPKDLPSEDDQAKRELADSSLDALLVSDADSALQRVYETRENFLMAAHRYTSRCLVVIAAIFTGAKFGLEVEGAIERSAVLILLAGVSVMTCYLIEQNKLLMKSVYFLYSSSAVEATIKGTASQTGRHTWFDAMEQAARQLDAGTVLPASNVKFVSNVSDHGSNVWRALVRRGIEFVEPSRNPETAKTDLAHVWAAKNENLLSTNVRIHDALKYLFLALGFSILILIPLSFFSRTEPQHIKPAPHPLNSKDGSSGVIFHVETSDETIVRETLDKILLDSKASNDPAQSTSIKKDQKNIPSKQKTQP